MFFTKNKKEVFGFTLIEILIVIAIFSIIFTFTVLSLRYFQKKSELNNTTEEIINSLRLAQNKTLASEGASSYGIYFNDTTSPNQYILFKGTSFASRDPAFDETFKLSNNLLIYQINLGGGKDVVFKRIKGETDVSGNIIIGLSGDSSKTKNIYIEKSGMVGLTLPTLPLDANRIKDSRHIHLGYNRNIQNDTFLQLIFPDYPSDNYDIVFQNYLNPAQTEFYWKGTVLVGPASNKTEQKLIIHTHILTSTSAQFCIHRDRGYNDKALQIKILEDTSGDLVSYTADGQESKGTSIYLLGDPQRQ